MVGWGSDKKNQFDIRVIDHKGEILDHIKRTAEYSELILPLHSRSNFVISGVEPDREYPWQDEDMIE